MSSTPKDVRPTSSPDQTVESRKQGLFPTQHWHPETPTDRESVVDQIVKLIQADRAKLSTASIYAIAGAHASKNPQTPRSTVPAE